MSGRHRKPTTSNVSVAKIAFTGAVLGGGGIAMAAQATAATTGNGIRWPAASRAATGRSTPATVTSVACSSLKAPGPHMVAASSPRRLSWPAGSSRLPSVSGCWPPRVAAPGRCAAAGYRTQHPAKCFPLRQRWTLRWTRPRSTANQHRWPRRPPTRRHPWNLPLTTCPHRWVNPSRQLPPTRHHPADLGTTRARRRRATRGTCRKRPARTAG